MTKKTTKTVREACELLKSKVRFEKAYFKLPGRTINDPDDAPAIREATRLYVETWIIPLIEAIADGDTNDLKRWIRAK